MNAEQETINKVFKLIETLTRQERDNVQYIYLCQFGEKIIPFCRRYFLSSDRVEVRVDLLRWTIEYAKASEEVVDFGIEALSDRSAKVRRYACLVLACSDNARAIPALKIAMESAKEPTLTDARNAIIAIEGHDWYLFHRSDPQDRTYVLPMRNDPMAPKDDDVSYYIKKRLPHLVRPLEEIFGSIYGKWRIEKSVDR